MITRTQMMTKKESQQLLTSMSAYLATFNAKKTPHVPTILATIHVFATMDMKEMMKKALALTSMSA